MGLTHLLRRFVELAHVGRSVGSLRSPNSRPAAAKPSGERRPYVEGLLSEVVATGTFELRIDEWLQIGGSAKGGRTQGGM